MSDKRPSSECLVGTGAGLATTPKKRRISPPYAQATTPHATSEAQAYGRTDDMPSAASPSDIDLSLDPPWVKAALAEIGYAVTLEAIDLDVLTTSQQPENQWPATVAIASVTKGNQDVQALRAPLAAELEDTAAQSELTNRAAPSTASPIDELLHSFSSEPRPIELPYDTLTSDFDADVANVVREADAAFSIGKAMTEHDGHAGNNLSDASALMNEAVGRVSPLVGALHFFESASTDSIYCTNAQTTALGSDTDDERVGNDADASALVRMFEGDDVWRNGWAK